MNRTQVEQYLMDMEVRDAAKRVREHRPLGWSDYLSDAKHHPGHARHMLYAALICFAVAFGAAVLAMVVL